MRWTTWTVRSPQPNRPVPTRSTPDDGVEGLRRLYLEERRPAAEVAYRLGISAAPVRAGLADHGIPVRLPGRPGTA